MTKRNKIIRKNVILCGIHKKLAKYKKTYLKKK